MDYINDKNVIEHILCKYLGYDSVPLFFIHGNIIVKKSDIKNINNYGWIIDGNGWHHCNSFYYPKMNVYKFKESNKNKFI
mmetsp:Transcript_76629/g.94073  ORF Transcript_76629/g.94073 Transcript_76629/m.94073 type:complete len:80 (+) Transcript_76629:3-242(+)